MNRMKHTMCRICGMNLESLTYDKMIQHAEKHLVPKGQKNLWDYFGSL